MSKSHVSKECMATKEKMEKEDTAGKGSASSRNGQLKEDYISREEKKSVFHSARSVFENSSYLETTRKGESSTVLSKTSQSTETRSESLKHSSQRTSVVTVSPQKGRQYENDNFTKQPPEKPDRKSKPGLSNDGTFLPNFYSGERNCSIDEANKIGATTSVEQVSCTTSDSPYTRSSERLAFKRVSQI